MYLEAPIHSSDSSAHPHHTLPTDTLPTDMCVVRSGAAVRCRTVIALPFPADGADVRAKFDKKCRRLAVVIEQN
jgi:hypothetical protein